MKGIRNKLRGLLIAPILALGAAPAAAAPILSIDLDPGTAGIQSGLTVSQGDIFAVDLVVTGDGTSAFDTIIFDIGFNDAGLVLSLNAGPSAGSLAGTGGGGLVLDLFGGLPLAPGNPLASDGAPLPPGFGDNLGGVGLASVGLSFATIAAGASETVLSLSYQAGAIGTSTLGIFGFPSASPLLALDGNAVDTGVQAGIVTVVPEPTSLTYFALGLFGLALLFRVKRRAAK